MLIPEFRRKTNGLPIASKENLEIIAENTIRDFAPSLLSTPGALDIDAMAEDYFGVELDFQYLSNNGKFLGVSVFNNTDRLIIYNPDKNCAEYLSVPARSVIIDNSLLSTDKAAIYRFTLAHEAGGHIYCHGPYFGYNPDQILLLSDGNAPIQKCRIILQPKAELKTDHDWLEWQANYMAAALLMPRTAVSLIANDFISKLKDYQDYKPIYDRELITLLQTTFHVSFMAASFRLKNLALPISNNVKRLF